MSNVIPFAQHATRTRLRNLRHWHASWRTVHITSGHGARCSLCDTPVRSTELAYRIEGHDTSHILSNSQPRRLLLHHECRIVWERACRQRG